MFSVRFQLLFALALFLAIDSSARAEGVLKIEPGDRIVTVGGAFAERLQSFGHFETLLHSRFPNEQLVVRGLGWSGDELSLRMRSEGFDKHGHELRDHRPTVVIAFYGFNESFAGPAGLSKFERDLEQFIQQIKTAKFDDKRPPRLVLVSPLAHENLKTPGLPDGEKNNQHLAIYTGAMEKIAKRHQVAFVDLFHPTMKRMPQSDRPWTINGIHLNAWGDQQVAEILDLALFGPRPATVAADLDKLKSEIDEKNKQFWYDYRAVNGCYIYGSRKEPFGVVNFPAEFAKLRKMVAVRDARIWAVAAGKEVPEKIDDSATGDFTPIETNYTDPITISTPDQEKASFILADGYEANLFASDIEFPDLKKPVQFEFDNRGRLWVLTMPSYPMYLPGTPVDDKLLILEDSNQDGRADKQTVFADKLYLPTGFELGDGGAYVAQQPNLVFLRDTNKDDQADQRETILHGFDSADSHHAISAFTWGPDGALYFEEGTFLQSAIETPYGPVRSSNAAVYRYEPRSHKLETFISYPFANPWGHVFDRWGQNFIADASPGANYFGTAISGQVDFPQKHGMVSKFLKKQWRPTSGCEIVSSRNFPDDAQGMFLLNNCIGFHGTLAYKFEDSGSGFFARPAPPILQAKDPNFRPVDLKFGPDGALYVIDWFNPLIGHMQHSIRDPNRDKTHGRIWRITYKGRPLVKPPKIAGASTAELIELLKTYEDRTRYRARRELRERPTTEVTQALQHWIANLDPQDKDYQHHLTEALWLYQQHDVVNEPLLKQQLRSPDYRARAAATRVLCYWRDRVQAPLNLLSAQAKDEHPRVRLEAVRAASFFDEPRAIDVALESLLHPQDTYLEYTLTETLNTLGHREHRWPAGSAAGAATLIQLLESDRVPDDQLPLLLKVACKRGATEELAKIYRWAASSQNASTEARALALNELASAATNRKRQPTVDRSSLATLIRHQDPTIGDAAIRLAGAWQAAETVDTLIQAALEKNAADSTRRDVAVALGRINAQAVQKATDAFLNDPRPELQALGVNLLTTIDLQRAGTIAARMLAAPQSSEQIARLLPGFVDRQGGTEKLAAALRDSNVSSDSAVLALRQLYALGRSDQHLVDALSKAAGIANDHTKLTPSSLAELSAQVLAKGNAERGESVFRRTDLGCMKCHTIGGVGGDVGPDLSAVGTISPTDYLITSLVDPDLHIKEVYVTRRILTDDGRIYSGVVVDRDENRVILKGANGEQITIPTADIDSEAEGKSLMPKGLVGLMTRAELLDLTRFLSELGKPGKYTIHFHPTVQRWKVARSAPTDIAEDDLDDEAMGRLLKSVAEKDWLVVYARVPGDLHFSDLPQLADGPLVLRSEVDVTEPGRVRFDIDDMTGVRLWIDGEELPVDKAALRLSRGVHRIVVRVDRTQHKTSSLKVTLKRPGGSKAAFTLVGGL